MNKQELEEQVAQLTATAEVRQKAIEALNSQILNLSNEISNLKASNKYLADYAEELRLAYSDAQAHHQKTILKLADASAQMVIETIQKAQQITDLAVERARTDTIAQCFDRTLQTFAGATQQ